VTAGADPAPARCPHLCDLMSWKGLAYLFLGAEAVEKFRALLE
jgi:hypothetical protein